MGRLSEKQQLQGLIGPLVLRNMNGKNVVQTRSSDPKQSKATRASAANFKYAVAQSQAIKRALRPLLLQGTDPYASQRLSGLLHKAFHVPQGGVAHLTLHTADLTDLIGFEFHKGTPLAQFMPVALPFVITDDGSLQLTDTMIAPIEYKLLPEANASCGLAVLVTAWLPESSDVAQTEVFGFELHRHIPTALALQSASYPTGTRFIVAVQLLVWKNMTALGDRNYYNHKLLNPVGVVFTGIRQ